MIPGPFKIVTVTDLGSAQATVTFASIGSAVPAGSKHLVLMWNVQADSGSPQMKINVNNDTTGIYHDQAAYGQGSTSAAGRTNGDTAWQNQTLVSTANIFHSGIAIFPNAFNTVNHKAGIALLGRVENEIKLNALRWAITGAIDEIDFTVASGNFNTGSTFILAVMDEDYALATVDRGSDGAVSFTSIDGTRDDLVIVGYGRGAAAIDGYGAVIYEINSDTTAANYDAQTFRAQNATMSAILRTDEKFIGHVLGDSSTANVFSAYVMFFQQYQNAADYPHVLAFSGEHRSTTDATANAISSRRANTAAITQIDLKTDFGTTTWKTGSYFTLYRLARNRIVDTELGAAADVVGGAVASGYDVWCGHLWGRTGEAGNLGVGLLEFNDDTTAANYNRQVMEAQGATMTAASQTSAPTSIIVPGSGQDADDFGGGVAVIIKPDKTDRHKTVISASGVPLTASDRVKIESHRWLSTAAITKWEYDVTGADQWAINTHFQIEGSNVPPATTAPKMFLVF